MDLLYSIFIDPFAQMAGAPDLLLQTLWEGLVGGVLYALIALGFVLIFKASGVFNFAQGIMVVFAALTLVGLFGVLTDFGIGNVHVAAFVALALTIAVMLALSIASTAVYAFTDWFTEVSVLLGLSLTLLITAVSGIMLPFRQPAMVEGSPYDRRVAGMPLFSLVGTLALLGFGADARGGCSGGCFGGALGGALGEAWRCESQGGGEQ